MPETRRASPRYLRFLITGGLVGILAAAILALRRADVVEQPWVLFFYLALLLGAIGALLGGLVAVVLEARRGS